MKRESKSKKGGGDTRFKEVDPVVNSQLVS